MKKIIDENFQIVQRYMEHHNEWLQE